MKKPNFMSLKSDSKNILTRAQMKNVKGGNIPPGCTCESDTVDPHYPPPPPPGCTTYQPASGACSQDYHYLLCC
jgi:natural product precursor